MKAVDPLGLVVFLAWCLFSVVALSPMEVVTIRLATQGAGAMQQEQEGRRGYSSSAGGATYSRLATQDGPASYSHQASVGRNGGGGSNTFKDGPPADKPLPSEPAQANGNGENATQEAPTPSRPSFAIDEEAAADEEDDDDAATAKDPLTGEANGAEGAKANGSSTPQSSTPQQPQPQASRQPFVDGGDQPYPQPAQAPYSSALEPPEPVIALRPVSTSSYSQAGPTGATDTDVVQPYNGFRDCLDKLVDEEGVEALYRGAWVTGLGALLGALT